MDKLTTFLFRICLIGLFLSDSKPSFSQNYNQKIANYITNVEHPFFFLKKYEQLGIKDVEHIKSLDSTFYWLKALAENAGYKTIETQFIFNWAFKDYTLRNLEFNKKGTNDSCIIICGHYDSKVGPGVNDNGSGDFAIYQIAKLMKSVETKYSLKFLFFTGEEIDYLGSRNFVSKINKDSVKIKFVLNLDQLGGTVGQDNSGIKCERDESTGNRHKSNALVQYMAKVYSLYTDLRPYITEAYSSDYLSFRDAGYVISGIYQYGSCPYNHTSEDLLKYMEFNSLVSATKGALAFLLHLSEAKINLRNLNTDRLNVYYSDKELIVFSDTSYQMSIYDHLGKLVLTNQALENETNFSVANLSPGIYYSYVTAGSAIICKKFLMQP